MPSLYLGKSCLDASFQDKFSATTKCIHCGGKAKIMFTLIEDGDKDYICDLYRTAGKKGKLWFHDAVSLATYACVDCLEATTIVNQA